MPNCSVACCKKRSQSSSLKRDGVSYHTFPKSPYLKEIWKKFCNNRTIWIPKATSTICSAHFTTADYRIHKQNKRRLLETSIPSQVPTCICPSHPLPQTNPPYYSIRKDASGKFYKSTPGRVKAQKKKQAREIISKVYDFMKKEARNNYAEKLTDARWRTAQAVGVSESTITRILREKRVHGMKPTAGTDEARGEQSNEPTTSEASTNTEVFVPPMKKRRVTPTKITCD